jgi:defect-in-organelle-trafficking protein DotC
MGLRLKAMHQAALTLGAQKAFIARMGDLRAEIESESASLDATFDFRRIMTLANNDGSETYVLPPIIEEAKNATIVEKSGNVLQVSGRVYKIHQHARLVTAPPDWRNFLFVDGDNVSNIPPQDLLPSTDDERKLWSEWIEEGWKAGVEQADAEMTIRIRRMARDFTGMVHYMRLVEVGKVNPPIVAVTNYDVVGGGDEMRELESLYRMTMPASFNPDAEEWRFIDLDPRGAIKQTYTK